jgi:hypothetical protein
MEGYTWGLKPEKELPYCWGARTIFRPPTDIDILWDRQQMVGGTEEERKKLSDWLNKKGIAALKKHLKKHYLGGADSHTETVTDMKAGFFIAANPQRSYGYLYLCAGPIVKEPEEVL